MGAIRIFTRFSNFLQFPEFQRFISAFCDDATRTINGNLDFVSNIRSSGPFTVGFTSASQVAGITHALNAIPGGFLTVNNTAPSVLYAAGASYAWTDKVIYLKASSGCTAIIYIIP